MRAGSGSIYGDIAYCNANAATISFVCDTVVLKKFPISLHDLAANEILALAACNHDCVLKPTTVKFTPDAILLYMPRYDIDLENVKLTVREKYSVVADIIAGVAHIHSAGLIHGDLKPANILIRRFPLRAVVCDLEISCVNEAGQTHYQPAYAPEYRAPEITSSPPYTFNTSADCWSIGCIMLRLSLNESYIGVVPDSDSSTIACALFGLPTSTRSANMQALYSLSRHDMGVRIKKKYRSHYRMYRDSGYIPLMRHFLQPKSTRRLDAASALATIEKISEHHNHVTQPNISILSLPEVSCTIMEDREELFMKCSPDCRKLAGYLHSRYGDFPHGNYAALYIAAIVCNSSVGVTDILNSMYPNDSIVPYVTKILANM